MTLTDAKFLLIETFLAIQREGFGIEWDADVAFEREDGEVEEWAENFQLIIHDRSAGHVIIGEDELSLDRILGTVG